jgi:MinD-like ATPase involved in chromosome partitioning or flagellar assembly
MTGVGSAIALVSAKGSPGVTTTALLLAAVWPGGATLLEADPAGGDLRTQFSDPTGQPLRADRGVVSLLTAQAHDDVDDLIDELTAHSQLLPGGLPVVLGPSNASQVEALRPQWSQLAHALRRHATVQHVVVIDAGRLGDPSSLALTLPLLRTCAATIVVARGTVTSLSHARDLLGLLSRVGIPTRLLLIADARDSLDVADAVGLTPGRLHVLPDDPISAAALTGPWNRKLDRSQLLTAARQIASSLHQQQTADPLTTVGDRLIDLTRDGALPA